MLGDNIQNSIDETSEQGSVQEKGRRFSRQNKKKSGLSPIVSESREDIETNSVNKLDLPPSLPTLWGKPFDVYQLSFFIYGLATLLANAAIVTDLGYFITKVRFNNNN